MASVSTPPPGSVPPPGAANPHQQPTQSNPVVPAATAKSSSSPSFGLFALLRAVAVALAAGLLIGHFVGREPSKPAASAGSTIDAPGQPDQGTAPAESTDAAPSQPGAAPAGTPTQGAGAPEAKSLAMTAAEAMETCAVDNGGSYFGCSKDRLAEIAPSLGGADDRLMVIGGSATYSVSVRADGVDNTFVLTRQPSGQTSRTCAKPDQSVCPNGLW